MNVLSHRLADSVRHCVAYWSPVPTQSEFITKGTITTQEFIEAGDQLTFKFPTWQWRGAVSRSRSVSWLPSDKQYLITCNVPSRGRITDLENTLSLKNAKTEGEGGWLVPGDDDAATEEEEISEIEKIPNIEPVLSCGEVRENYVTKQDDARDDIPDIATFDDVDNLLEQEDDPAADDSHSSYFVRNAPDAEVVRTQTFDVSITYDKYYRTPRIWLFGYDENGVPLAVDKVFDYILTEYASKTVTVDPHPCTGVPTVSIHPCKHASVMSKVVNNWIQQGYEPRHDLCLFVLLKLISSVIPTIDYDFTMDVEMFIHRSPSTLMSNNNSTTEGTDSKTSGSVSGGSPSNSNDSSGSSNSSCSSISSSNGKSSSSRISVGADTDKREFLDISSNSSNDSIDHNCYS